MAALVDLLLAGVERAATPFIEALSASELSGNEILSTLKDYGIGIRRTNGLELIRQFRNINSVKPYIDGLRLDRLPNPERLAESATNILRNYSYKVSLDGTHAVTGEKVTQYVTVSTNRLLNKQAAVDIATSMALEDPSLYPIDITHARITNVTKNPMGIL